MKLLLLLYLLFSIENIFKGKRPFIAGWALSRYGPLNPTKKFGPSAQLGESGRRMLALCSCGESSPGVVPVISGGLLGVGCRSKGRNCRLPAPVTGRRRLFSGLFSVHDPIVAGVWKSRCLM